MQNIRKDIVISFRVTAAEAAHIDAAGVALKKPRQRNDFARSAALHFAGQKVPPPIKPARLPVRRKAVADVQVLTKILGQLGKIGSNVNQMARVANESGDLPSKESFLAVGADLLEAKSAISVALTGKGGGDGD